MITLHPVRIFKSIRIACYHPVGLSGNICVKDFNGSAGGAAGRSTGAGAAGALESTVDLTPEGIEDNLRCPVTAHPESVILARRLYIIVNIYQHLFNNIGILNADDRDDNTPHTVAQTFIKLTGNGKTVYLCD